jgi:hypothetical protein
VLGAHRRFRRCSPTAAIGCSSAADLRDAEHALRSKHFRPTEHYWYFSRDGLVFAMKGCGFALVAESNVETELGREDIGTFAFRRDGG